MEKYKWNLLNEVIDGDLKTDELHRKIYSTDASVYRIIPSAIVYPKNDKDVKEIILFASVYNISITPRATGTSLAGQTVGFGIIVDFSKYFTKVISFNPKDKEVCVQPGIIRDELNLFLKKNSLFFSPNTSTSNRATIGGMVGNNSSGSTSIKYGVTRDKVKKIKAVLSDGTTVEFGDISKQELCKKLKLNTLEGDIYRYFHEINNEKTRKLIKTNLAKPEIHRRNTGYAIDSLLDQISNNSNDNYNLCPIICGSEGTLILLTEITLSLDDLPPKQKIMFVAHFDSLDKCFKAVVPVMKHDLYSCEMIDKIILDCTKDNISMQKNRQFVDGDPTAILMMELRSNCEIDLNNQISNIREDKSLNHLSYSITMLKGVEINKAIELRKAGLGLLGNLIGDKKAVACIEDTAVDISELSDYMKEFSIIMEKHNQKSVYYAHAGAGEIHLRPILNLKKRKDVILFEQITKDVSYLVKKFKGTLSGEHGDGIVRSGFIRYMVGDEIFKIFEEIKYLFDSKNIFNPGKIINSLPITENLRYIPDREEPIVKTFFNFDDSGGILRLVEKCNGSGDCRKSHEFQGTMCPSYRATKNEKDTTRARANLLREYLTNNDSINKFNQKELKTIFDLCLSCKACKSECPSNVDIATVKSEFLYQYYKSNRKPLRDVIIAFSTELNSILIHFSLIINTIYKNKLTSKLFKKTINFSTKRSLPFLDKFSYEIKNNRSGNYTVTIIIDEFTRFLDGKIGKSVCVLLEKLGYSIDIVYIDSARSMISKGFLKQAKIKIDKNITILSKLTSDYIVGIEPSSVSVVKDENIRLASDKELAKELAKKVFFFEEFIALQINEKKIVKSSFSMLEKNLKIHNHCHFKSLSNQKFVFDILNLPPNYTVSIISSGCCGMAGSFGFEKEHFDVSMKIGNLSLFPSVLKNRNSEIIANGTSCRHQIFDGTGEKAKHPAEILLEAVK